MNLCSFLKKTKTNAHKDDVSLSSSTSSSSSSSHRVSSSSSATTYEEVKCLKDLASFCKETERDISTDLLFRIAHFHDFEYKRAQRAVITNASNKYLNLRMEGGLASHFGKEIVFPLPQLKTKDGSSVVYLRPSHYSGKKSSQLMVESLCYVLNDLSRTQSQCRDGVTVIVNMKKWARGNFDQEMWVKLIRILQGDLVPTAVKQVLLVDVPEEFQRVWDLLEELTPYAFLKNVRSIKQEKLSVFLKKDYLESLPSDIRGGWLNASEVNEDYIDQKRYDDQQCN